MYISINSVFFARGKPIYEMFCTSYRPIVFLANKSFGFREILREKSLLVSSSARTLVLKKRETNIIASFIRSLPKRTDYDL